MIHIDANKEDIAELVLMPGDPLRAKFIAENFLDNFKQINYVRNMFGYTGEYKGKKITVIGSGMGMPSMGIYAYELFTGYDVKTIIRIGSCGSINEDLKLREVVLVNSTYNEGNFALNFNSSNSHIAYPDSNLNNLIEDIYNKKYKDIFKLKKENITTTECFDVYMQTKEQFWNRLPKDLNIKACEMEAFALFEIAKTLNKKAACLLTVVDGSYTTEKLTPEEREKDLNNMIILALDTIINI